MNKATPAAQKKKTVHTQFQMERVFRIMELINSRNYPDVQRFIEEFGVDRRTIMRDLRFLRESLGAPLVYDKNKKGYCFTDYFTITPPKKLDELDLLTLQFLQHSLMAYRSTGIGKKMLESFEHMFGLLTGDTRWRELDSMVAFRGEAQTIDPNQELNTLKLIFSAIRSKSVLSFTYHPRKKPADKREVEPHLLAVHKGRWYLYGIDCSIRALRTFAIGRITEIKCTHKGFHHLGEPITPDSLFRYSFGMMAEEGEPKEVVIDFNRDAADLIRESLWHPEQKLENLENGGVRFRVKLTSFYEIKPWILSWGVYAKVVSPQELVEEVSEALKSAACQYSR